MASNGDSAGNGADEDLGNTEVVAANEGENGQLAEGEAPAAPPPAAGGGAWAMFKTLAIRMVVIYMISSFLRRPSSTQQQQDALAASEKGGGLAKLISTNLYTKDMNMDMYIYVSEDEFFTDFEQTESLFWLEEEMGYGDWTGGMKSDGIHEKRGTVKISEAVQNNGSLFLHIYFVRAGRSPNPRDKDNYEKQFTVVKTKKLNKMKKRKFHTMKNLLTGSTDVHPDLVRNANESTVEILSHWHPNLTINMIDDQTPWTKGSVPSPLDEYIEFQPGTNFYYPIVYFNEYWNLQKDYQPINSTTPELNLTLTFEPLSLFKWQMYAAQGMRSRWYSFMGEGFAEESDEEQDTLKETLVETNPYLLAITIVVSIVHSVFEFLAFKNDIQFWRNRKSLEGLSVRSVFFNVFQSLVVLLYVLDNETNFVVRISVFIGLGIEMWKITKVSDVTLDRENKWLGVIPRLVIAEKKSYTESDTKYYDQLAYKYLSWLLFPLLVGYCVYSVMYQEHRSWYSFVLNILYGFLLTFGFIMMTPQLFINYKMKSVAHLPWRMLTYKALNTFIDDLFAFVIKMPILYRIGCFRDDIVFIIFVYQKYIYPVDHKRMNEFGTSGEMHAQMQNGVVPPIEDAGTEGAAIEAPPGEDSGREEEDTPPEQPPKTEGEKKQD